MQRFESLESRRFLAGDLTSSFGDRGRLTKQDAVAMDVVQQSSGKLVVATVNADRTFAFVTRLNSNGSRDLVFPTQTFPIPSGYTGFTQIKQASDGSLRVLAGGTIYKLTADGQGGTGFAAISGVGGFDMTPDGGIYGFTQTGVEAQFHDPKPLFSNVVRRFRYNGDEMSRKTLAPATVPSNQQGVEPFVLNKFYEINVGPGGQFIAAAYQNAGSDSDYGAVVRWTVDGTLDSSFSSNGISEIYLDLDASHSDLQLLPSGRIILAQDIDDGESLIYQFESNGSVETEYADTVITVGNGGSVSRIVPRGNDGFVAIGSLGAGDYRQLGGDLEALGEGFGDQIMGVYDPAASGNAKYGMSYLGFQPSSIGRLDYGQANAGVFTNDGDLVVGGYGSTAEYSSTAPRTAALAKFAFSTPVAQRVGEIAWVENNTLYVETGATNDVIEFFNDANDSTQRPSEVRLLPSAGANRFAYLNIPTSVTRTVINTFAGGDTITGSALPDQLFGGTGPDRLLGGYGNDTLEGGAGGDTLIGDAGNDLILGGIGQDFAEGRAGNDSIYGGDNQDNLFGGSGNDLIEGNASNDFLVGEAGNDALIGGSGNDTMNGGSGTDFLDGNDGIDTELFRSSIDTRYNMEIFA